MKSKWNTNFFTRQAMANISHVLHSTYTGDTTCWVLFDLDNSKTQSITTTLKIRFSRYLQISVRKPNFFVGRLQQKFLFFSSFIWHTQEILHAEFGSIWTTLRPNQKQLHLKSVFRKICKFLYENLFFFRRQALAEIFFVLHFIYTSDTLFRVLLNLNNFLTQSKTTMIKIR